MLDILEISFTIAILNTWFVIMRKPGELLSFYDRALIGIDETKPVFHKMLTCSLCHTGYMALIYIFWQPDLNYNHILILPFSMVIFTIVNRLFI